MRLKQGSVSKFKNSKAKDSLANNEPVKNNSVEEKNVKNCEPNNKRSEAGTSTMREEVIVPCWRETSLKARYKLEGTENTTDDFYLRRHQKHENEEKQIKRWDIRRQRDEYERNKLLNKTRQSNGAMHSSKSKLKKSSHTSTDESGNLLNNTIASFSISRSSDAFSYPGIYYRKFEKSFSHDVQYIEIVNEEDVMNVPVREAPTPTQPNENVDNKIKSLTNNKNSSSNKLKSITNNKNSSTISTSNTRTELKTINTNQMKPIAVTFVAQSTVASPNKMTTRKIIRISRKQNENNKTTIQQQSNVNFKKHTRSTSYSTNENNKPQNLTHESGKILAKSKSFNNFTNNCSNIHLKHDLNSIYDDLDLDYSNVEAYTSLNLSIPPQNKSKKRKSHFLSNENDHHDINITANNSNRQNNNFFSSSFIIPAKKRNRLSLNII